MTEAEWLAGNDLRPMLRVHRVESNARKLRLFVRACCGRVEHLMNPEALIVLEVAERYADGLAGPAELCRARDALRRMEKRYRRGVHRPERRCAEHAARLAGNETIAQVAADAVWGCQAALDRGRLGESWRAWAYPVEARYAMSEFVPLLREVYGNPFAPARLAPAWRTRDVASLAQAAYEERILPARELDPLRLAVLADALEEVGCTDGDLLGHLRSPGPHVRGCWALDVVLGKG